MSNIVPMIERKFWIQRIQEAWEKRPIVWLSGVRRLVDTEPFYDSLDKGSIVIFDEIHRLEDPSRLLKIAADAIECKINPNIKSPY